MAESEPQAYELSSDDEGDDVQERKNKFEERRNAFIYLLDSRKKMFSRDYLIEDEIPFLQCLKCIRNSARAKIWASDKALCAFILLGTNKADNVMSLSNIAVIEPLKILSSDFVMNLNELAKKVEDSSFEKEYGWSTFSLADALWLCFRMFHDSAKNMKLNKTIILFTNDDNPSNNDRNEFNRIISCAGDMVETKIMFDLINLGENFNVNNLFKELIQLSRGDMDYEIPDPVTKMKEMVNRSLRIDYRHVTLANIPFQILDDFKFDVSVHYLVRKVKLPFKVKLSKATNEVVTTKTQFFETETGERVPTENLVKSYKFGGKEITFTTSELEHIESFSDKGLKLIGFKPASVVNLEHFVQPCAFIYPSDPEEGSSFFVALLTKCLEKQVVPICTFCPRSRSSLRYVALIAQEEETAPDNTQLCPDGFLVFFLPFAEEVRDLDSKCTGKNRASQDQVLAAKKLIKKLKFNYKSDIFKNPRLASHWSAVEALALNLKEPEPFHDSTVPNYTLMRERTKAVADEFRDLIYTDGYDPEANAPRKRAKPFKPAKAAEEGVEVDAAAVEDIIRSGEVMRLTNDALKSYLHKVGEGKGTSKMKKSDLLEKACNYLNIPVPSNF